jgi:hypothetical protein
MTTVKVVKVVKVFAKLVEGETDTDTHIHGTLYIRAVCV